MIPWEYSSAFAEQCMSVDTHSHLVAMAEKIPIKTPEQCNATLLSITNDKLSP
jgi:hypothetical protein